MILVAFLMISVISVSKGNDPFEGFVRVECYQNDQPGCDKPCSNANSNITKCKDVEFINGSSTTGGNYADTHLYLFTHENPDVPELLHKCCGGLPPNSSFNPTCRTEIILPGFVSGVCNYAIFREIKNELLKCKKSCRNVILVDWMWGNNIDLLTAKLNVKIVAKQVVCAIEKLKEEYGLDPDHFILTGHSYGAHMAGLVGQETKVSTINGIEPAGVLYTQDMELNERLDAGDADCVQVMHTNAGQCLIEYFGVNFTCGDFDVWYNDGLHQPACYNQIGESFMKQDFVYAFFSLLPAACSHLQALQYYKASINPGDCQQIGVSGENCNCVQDFYDGKCNDCGDKGFNCLSVGAYGCDCYRARGKKHTNYYLTTTNECPFCVSGKDEIAEIKNLTDVSKFGALSPGDPKLKDCGKDENVEVKNLDKVKCGTLSPCDTNFKDCSFKMCAADECAS